MQLLSHDQLLILANRVLSIRELDVELLHSLMQLLSSLHSLHILKRVHSLSLSDKVSEVSLLRVTRRPDQRLTASLKADHIDWLLVSPYHVALDGLLKHVLHGD